MSGPDEEILRRHFIAIATASYDDPTWIPLPGVPEEVAALRTWLCAEDLTERRFDPCYPELANDPSEEVIRARLKNLARGRVWTDADAAVLFVTGHGVQDNDTHFMILHDSDSSMLSSTALRTSDLLAWLADTPVQHLLVILDACYAGKVAADVLRLGKNPRRRWLVLPSATHNQVAVTGALTTAIGKFLAGLRTPEGRRYGEGPYLDVAAFVQDVEKLLGDGQSLIPLYGSQITGSHVCLPNPHYRPDDTIDVHAARQDLALPRQDLNAHWGPRSRGVASAEQPGWLFSGRGPLMRELIAAATGVPGTTMVTGGAGSGKSTVLARLVTLSDEGFRIKHAADVAAIPADLCPPLSAVDVAVLATGKLPTEILAQICRALAVPTPPSSQPEPTLDERLLGWHAWLVARPQPVTIVIDALDEATDPRALVRQVLTRLEPDPAAPRLRLLIGARSLAATDDSGRGSPADIPALVHLVETTLRARRIPVDEPPWWDQSDVVAYINSILSRTPGSPYQDNERGTAAVAVALGQRVGRSFLIARIAASSLAAREAVIAADDQAWLAALDQGVLGAFRDDLHYSLTEPDDRRRAVILLRAVAFAYGAGLPWRGIWPLVAHAVDDDGGYYGDSDIAWLLDSRLGAYLVTSTEDDTTVYRLFHALLRTTLRDRWTELLDLRSDPAEGAHPAPNSSDRAGLPTRAVETRIARELARLADVDATIGCDRPPPAYIRRHLCEHAAAGGVLNDATLPVRFLPYIDPVRLRAAAISATAGARTGRLTLLPVIRQVTHEWDWEYPARNAAAISLRAALNQQPLTAPIGGQWHVRWGIDHQSTHEILTRADRVRSMATAVLPGGRVIAVSGGDDATVRVWDLTTGTAVGEPLVGHTGVVYALATAVLPGGRVIAVSGGDDATVRVWDLTTGTALGEPLVGHTGVVYALATAVLPGGRVIAVSGGDDATVRVWDLTTGTALGEPLVGHTGVVYALATAVLPGGQVIAVSGGGHKYGFDDPAMRAWDLTDGTQPAKLLIGHFSAVLSMATATLPDGTAVVVSGGDSVDGYSDYKGSIRTWDLNGGEPREKKQLTQFVDDTSLCAMATAVLPGGRAVALSGGSKGDLQVWDLATGVAVGDPLSGHYRGVLALATAALPDGRVIAVSGGDDGTIRVWDLTAGIATTDQLNDGTNNIWGAEVETLSDGRVVAVVMTEGYDRTIRSSKYAVRAWDLTTGAPIAKPIEIEGGGMWSMTVLPDSRAAVVTCGNETDGTSIGPRRTHTVRVWDLATGIEIGEPRPGCPGAATMLITGILSDGRAVAVTRSDSYDPRKGQPFETVRVWDLATGEAVGERRVSHDQITRRLATAVLPDGRVVALTNSREGDRVNAPQRRMLSVWDLATGEDVSPPIEHPEYVTSTAFARLPGGQVVALTGSARGTVRVWDLATGEAVGDPLICHTKAVRAIATATLADGRVVAVTSGDGLNGGDGMVRVWDLASRMPIGAPLTLRPDAGREVATATLADGRVIAVTSSAGSEWNGRVVGDGLVHVWDLTTGAPIGVPLHSPGRTLALHQDRAALWIVVGGRGLVVAELHC